MVKQLMIFFIAFGGVTISSATATTTTTTDETTTTPDHTLMTATNVQGLFESWEAAQVIVEIGMVLSVNLRSL